MPKSALNLINCLVTLFVGPSLLADQIELFNGGTDEPIISIDAVFADCRNDEFFTGPPSTIDIGLADSSVDCSAEIVVFSDDNAVEVVSNPLLTANPNDLIPITLKPRWQVPLKFWVIRSDNTSGKSAYEALLDQQVMAADLNFNESHAGVAFPSWTFEWVEDVAVEEQFVSNAEALLTGDMSNSEFRQFVIQSAPTASAGTITVYVIPSALFRGFHIRNDDRTSSGIIVLGSGSTNSTLSHELGHAFSLNHINYYGEEPLKELAGEYCVAFGEHKRYDGNCDYNTTNLMWAGIDSERKSLTEGQAIRVNVNSFSYLNDPVNGIRPDTEVSRDCPDWWYDAACPYLAIDDEETAP